MAVVRLGFFRERGPFGHLERELRGDFCRRFVGDGRRFAGNLDLDLNDLACFRSDVDFKSGIKREHSRPTPANSINPVYPAMEKTGRLCFGTKWMAIFPRQRLSILHRMVIKINTSCQSISEHSSLLPLRSLVQVRSLIHHSLLLHFLFSVR